MISDVIALGLSMVALKLATRQPNARFTFGFLRFEIIASFLNGLALCIIALGIFIEGIQRIINPQPIHLALMLGIASIGFVVNLVLTLVLHNSVKEEDNLNVKSALWHFFGDLRSSVGVIISSHYHLLHRSSLVRSFDFDGHWRHYFYWWKQNHSRILSDSDGIGA